MIDQLGKVESAARKAPGAKTRGAERVVGFVYIRRTQSWLWNSEISGS